MRFLERLFDAASRLPHVDTALGLLILAACALIAHWFTRGVLLRLFARLVRASPMRWDDALLSRRVPTRIGNLVPALVLVAGLPLVPGLDPGAIEIVDNILQAAMVLTIALAVAGLLSAFGDAYARDPERAQARPIKGYLQVGRIVVFAMAAISIVATLIGVKFSHVLTGLGAMTAVIMLVFQDTILSFVASVQIGSDGRVRVGDWIEMPSQNADGDVTDIALHTVTVRNWDKTITTIPTKKLISESFRNWRGMTEAGGRRIKRALYLDQKSVRFLRDDECARLARLALLDDYLRDKDRELATWNAEHADGGAGGANARRLTNLGTFRAYVERYLRAHPGIRQDMTLLVRQLQPEQTGIPLEVYCFSADTRWAAYETVQSDLFDHLLAVLPEFGLRVFQSSSDAALDVRLLTPADAAAATVRRHSAWAAPA